MDSNRKQKRREMLARSSSKIDNGQLFGENVRLNDDGKRVMNRLVLSYNVNMCNYLYPESVSFFSTDIYMKRK